ncbi:exodeoxyribonuclease VII large subunit [Sporosarcina sp. ACRSL]|uniref:exodeoxyribonuclease VII large subunit n=1 Tax=Sporosarcina sp. ACRSL TaxID=2918215 RepID=UPI001EF60006|nr:exodeoxyribonuclease VII large subunit [Sporosarcina sp. ACRSL]MCG7345170.1 exodeoxyribonuclease VII large subunit [Sporosarcina sp. ACRSL]
MSENTYLSVHSLTKYIKRKFEADPYLRNVFVKGELSNVKIHPSGHIYFTLKDDKSRIQSAMFRSAAGSLKFKPEEGMNVLITGDVNVYESSGQYQLYVQTMQPDGIGSLYLAYEQLKTALAKEGLFDARWKQRLPALPKKIGVITAQSGAAIRDICSTLQRRYPLAEIYLFPAIVQGPQAAPSIVRALELAESHGSIDVLILGRGGGSIEDLWAFNEETVARAIFSCRIPIISAVGHETDTTIADFVADMRAPTPTAAAELAVPSKEELFERILERKRSIYMSFANQIKHERKRLTTYQQSYPLQFPERLYRPFTEKLSGLDERLHRSRNELTASRKADHDRLTRMLSFYSPIQRIKDENRNLLVLSERLTRAAQNELRNRNEQFNSTIRMLKALNPLEVMDRGFAIVYKAGNVTNSVDGLKIGETLKVRLQDGTVETEIKKITMTDEEEN